MRTWLLTWWDSLRTSFWFVPSLMVVGSIVLSLTMLHVDQRADAGWMEPHVLTYSRGPEGSRALLATVAGSMITIASLAFSITIVTLQLTSSQFGPRLPRNFVRDRGNQFVLGTFVATFTYCLLVLRTVNGTEGEEFVPHLSVIVALLLALASLAVLIYFIHHTAHAIQAETVVDAVGRDLRHAIDRLLPRTRDSSATSAPVAGLPDAFREDSQPVLASRGNYLQAIDRDRLLDLARSKDLVLNVLRAPGGFVMEGQGLVEVHPASRLDAPLAAAIRKAFYFGPTRTMTQDAEYGVNQLVEIAVRALSPGINDPFTAMACVDRLGDSIVHFAGREIPSALGYDDEGQLRIVARPMSRAGFVDAAFHQVRHAARSNAAVTIRLLEVIGVVLALIDDAELRDALLRHADVIHEESRHGLLAAVDREQADRCHGRIRRGASATSP